MGLEQAPDSLTDEVVVLGEHEPDRHGRGYGSDVRPAEPPLVLIVDDNRMNLKLARDLLRAAGFRTLEAESGAEGIALATEHLPDVILMDLRLPDMDGTDAARALAGVAQTARIPIVALSAVPFEGDGELAPRRRIRRLSREADQRSRVPGAGASLLHGRRRLSAPAWVLPPPSGVPALRQQGSGHGRQPGFHVVEWAT